MSARRSERPMTIAPVHVAQLRELVDKWERALVAHDFEGTTSVGSQLVGAVGALLKRHDAESADGGSS